jgi:hypothetical protein
VEKVEISVNSLRQLVEDLRAYLNKSLEGLKNQPSDTPAISEHDDFDSHDTQTKLEKLRKQVNDNYSYLISLIEKKAEKGDLENIERKLNSRLDDLIRNFIDRFADKKDTLKRLLAIEKQVKTLYEMLMTQESHRANEDDAMFTKKPLGGVSCASCEKNITNLQGQMAEFQPWKRLPFKEPGERISRVSSSIFDYFLVWARILEDIGDAEAGAFSGALSLAGC